MQKTRTFALLFVLLAAFASRADPTPAPEPSAAAKPPREEGSPLVVVLDPGHGGPFPHDGAHGTRGLVEKVVALQVAKKLQAQLEAAGATVLLTRENDDADVSLADRARFANEANADLFLSIHCNSMATRHDRTVTRGVETYFLSPDSTDAEAKLLAELENGGPAAVALPKTTDAVSGLLADLALGQARNDSAQLAETLHRAVIRKTYAPSRGVRQAPFLVLSGTRMPSALIEIGFISHPAEGKLLSKDSYQLKIAEALAQGVREFAARVLLRRLLPPTDEARADLLARRSAAAHSRAAHRTGQPNSLGHQSIPENDVAAAPAAGGTTTPLPAPPASPVAPAPASPPVAPVAAPPAAAAPIDPIAPPRSTALPLPSPSPVAPLPAPIAAPPSVESAPLLPSSAPAPSSPGANP